MGTKIILHRLVGGLLSLFIVSFLAFLLILLVPGDPARVIAGPEASAATVEQIRSQLGLNQPVLERYGQWMLGIFQGDLGTSIYTGRSVAASIIAVAPATLFLTLLATVIATVLGVSAGMIAGIYHDSWIDRSVTSLATAGIAMPNFWVGMLLVTLFAVTNPWLPPTGYVPPSAGIGAWLAHLVLPATALALASAAELARQARAGVVDVLRKPYIRAARARGAAGLYLARRHIVRNASIPVLTVLGLQTGRLLGGAIVIEAVFGISGLGSLAVDAVLQRDYPMIQGYVLLAGLVVISINLLVDMAYMWINPKVRSE